MCDEAQSTLIPTNLLGLGALEQGTLWRTNHE